MCNNPLAHPERYREVHSHFNGQPMCGKANDGTPTVEALVANALLSLPPEERATTEIRVAGECPECQHIKNRLN